MLNSTIYSDPSAFETLGAEWDRLSAQGMTNTPFQSLAYQKAWWNNLGSGQFLAVSVRNSGGDLVAIAPLFLADSVLYFNGGLEETDYLDLIAPAEFAADAWTAVLDSLESDAVPAWSALDLCNVPEDSPTRQHLPLLTASRGLAFSTEFHDVCPIIPLPTSFEDYLSSLDKKQRHEIRRKIRRAETEELKLVIVSAGDDLEAAVADFLLLLQKSSPEKRAWLNDGRRAAFFDVGRGALAAGILQLMFLRKDGQNAAGLFNFDYNGRVWVYNSGLDPEAFGWLSPGVVLTAQAIELAIANGRQTFDFLRGSEPYKYRFGALDTGVDRLRISRTP